MGKQRFSLVVKTFNKIIRRNHYQDLVELAIQTVCCDRYARSQEPKGFEDGLFEYAECGSVDPGIGISFLFYFFVVNKQNKKDRT